MFSTRCGSSRHTAPGRHSSRRLQLEQVTSNLRVSGWFMKMTLRSTATAAADCMRPPGSLFSRGALRDDLAHALELPALVEEIARPEPLGELPVRVGGEVGQHVEIDLGRDLAPRAQHVEAAAFAEVEIQHDDVGARNED